MLPWLFHRGSRRTTTRSGAADDVGGRAAAGVVVRQVWYQLKLHQTAAVAVRLTVRDIMAGHSPASLKRRGPVGAVRAETTQGLASVTSGAINSRWAWRPAAGEGSVRGRVVCRRYAVDVDTERRRRSRARALALPRGEPAGSAA